MPVERHVAFASDNHEVLVSARTIWELETKRAPGRLEAPNDRLHAIEATMLA